MQTAKVIVSGDLIAMLLSDGYEASVKCTQGLPEGAELISVELDLINRVELLFRHESFAEVAEGVNPPLITPVFVEWRQKE